MAQLSAHDITVMFLALGILLGVARILGELAQRFKQPAVLGELLAGVLLGPTVLGNIYPVASAYLFPAEGSGVLALSTVSVLAVTLFLLVAGMEVDLSSILRQGSVATKVSISGIVIPFLLGLLAAWFLPQALGRHTGSDHLVFALFFATALSISALPVVAKTLMDLNLYRSDLGMVIVSAAVLDDLIGWILFAIILGLAGAGSGHSNDILQTIVMTLAFAVAVLTAGRWLIHKSLPFLQKHTRWPSGVLGFALTLAFLGAAFTEWIGIHAIFGAFIVGVALGDSPHLRERTRVTIDQFVSSVFAPIFFATIGLRVNFLTHFDLPLVLTVFGIACLAKLAGGVIGARWGNMSRRDAWVVGLAMNSRGAMEIILGLLALEAGIIRHRLFVALVIMAILTSLMSGPAIRLILSRTSRRSLRETLTPRLFLPALHADSRRGAIHEMVAALADSTGMDPKDLEAAVWAREGAQATGIGNGVALPHAKFDALHQTAVVIGISKTGIDFDAPDRKPARIIFLVVTPARDAESQLELGAEIATLFEDEAMVARMLRTENFEEFLSLVPRAGGEQRVSGGLEP